jgi:CheY-like chemotaxis protein
LLANEGYKTLTAASAEDALELLKSNHPQLVLADVQLPGMDGLEMTRQIKSGAGTADIGVIALTAYASSADERKALDAGCDGYITKPIDTRALGSRVREFLEKRVAAARPEPSVAVRASIPAAEMLALRQRFLTEGMERLRQLMAELEGRFPADEAARAVHQWAGTGGLLGYWDISRLAREAEAVLAERPLDNAQLRESLEDLAVAFNSPPNLA